MPSKPRGKYDHKEPGVYKVDPNVPDTVDDRFYVRLHNPSGGLYQKLVRGRRAASAHRAQMRTQLATGGIATAADRRKTVRELLAEIAESKPGLSPNTRRNYESQLRNHVLPVLGDKRVADLVNGYLLLTGLFNDVEKRRGRAARRTVEQHVRELCKVAVRQGLLDRNPLDGIRWAEPSLVRGQVFLPTVADLHAVRTYIATPQRRGTMMPGQREQVVAITDVLAGTGLRIGEAVAIAEDDIDDGMLYVKRQVIYVPLTKEEIEAGATRSTHIFAPPKTDVSGVRRVPLPKFVTAALATQRLRNGVREIELPYAETADELDPDNLRLEKRRLLFFSLINPGAPFPPQNIQQRVHHVAEAVKLSGDLHPHCYRHFYTTALSDGGVPQNVIDHVTGHLPSGSVTSKRYIHVTDDGLVQARRAIEAAWGQESSQDGISISS